MTETASTPHRNLSIDQQLALRTAATHLAREFDGVFGQETIERFLHTSYDQFAGRSTIPNFLPLIAERFARQRLCALAKVEGHHVDGKPVVLFLCVHTPAAARWPWASSNTSPETAPSPGPAAPNPASRSTRRPSPR